MGTTIDQFDIIARLWTEGHLPFGARIGDIGCQQLFGEGNVEGIRRFLKVFGRDNLNSSVVEEFAKNRAFIGHCLRAVGFDYTSFDVVEAPFCRFLDLETDAAPDPGSFDLVLNFGTTEHVLNQFNALKILHDMAKPGGLIYSYFIRGGHMEHGLLHYSDRFVDMWMSINHYEQIWRQDQADEGEECTWIVVRKSREGPFHRIIDAPEGEVDKLLAVQLEQEVRGDEKETDVKKLVLQLERKLRGAEQELDAMRRSNSWRITAPLRKAAHFLRH